MKNQDGNLRVCLHAVKYNYMLITSAPPLHACAYCTRLHVAPMALDYHAYIARSFTVAGR